MKFLAFSFGVVLCLSILLLSGCDRADSVKEISETRLVDEPVTVPANLTSAQRFGLQTASASSSTQEELPFTYDVPEGWVAAPANSMRLVNLVPGGDTRAECYVTILPGAGGGVEANVNRWRKQMSLEPYTEQELAALPRRELLGAEAIYVEFDGVYRGMSGDQNEPDFKLLGLILPLNNSGLFIKMLGPKELIDQESSRFNAFCASFKIRQGSTTQSTSPPMEDTHTHPDGLELQWTAPEEWTQAADRPMRVVTFNTGADGSTECYVSIFPGDAGGLVPNLNRWARQIGADPFTEPVIAELPTVTVMGTPAPIVELSGPFSDSMSGIEIADATLLGVIAEHAGHSIFIKLVGPAADVAAQKARFVAFCESITH